MTQARKALSSPASPPAYRGMRPEVFGLFGLAAALLFGVIFSISSAVMAPPRDVRLAATPTAHSGTARPSKISIESAAAEAPPSIR